MDEKIINDSKSIATKFNNFFGSMSKTIDMKTPPAKNRSQTAFKTYKYKFSTSKSCNKKKEHLTLIWVGEGGGVKLPPSWFSLNNSETVRAVTLEFCSIQ